MKFLGGMLLGTVLLLLVSAVVIIAMAFHGTNVCYSQFDTQEAAELAARMGWAAGYQTEIEPRNKHVFVTFYGGSHDPFARIVRQNDGRFAHPGGCTTKALGD